MRRMTSPPPFGASRSELPLAENPWLALWRTFWLDLPLAWAGEVDRLLFQWVPPADVMVGRRGRLARHRL